MPRTVLVTGAAGGLGGATAELFAERAWRVFAADLTPPPPAPGTVPIRMDVTDGASCAAAAREIAGQADLLDAVINFAGVLEVGRPLVEVPEERMRRSLEVNVLGTHLVNQAMFELVRAGRGRIVNISSEAGRHAAMPLSGPYAVSKHAVEAYSDALRRELMFVGVSVAVVQPGPFRTSMTGAIADLFAAARNPDSPFDRLIGKVGRSVADEDARARDPRELAEAVWKATTAKRPQLRYAVRHDRRRALLDKLPARVVDRVLRASLN